MPQGLIDTLWGFLIFLEAKPGLDKHAPPLRAALEDLRGAVATWTEALEADPNGLHNDLIDRCTFLLRQAEAAAAEAASHIEGPPPDVARPFMPGGTQKAAGFGPGVTGGLKHERHN